MTTPKDQPSKEDRRYNQVELSRSRANIKALKADNSILSLDKLVLESQLTELREENERLRDALKFYACGNHFEFLGLDINMPDSVSGEPANLMCGGDDDHAYQYEDGWVARDALTRSEAPECGAKGEGKMTKEQEDQLNELCKQIIRFFLENTIGFHYPDFLRD